MIEDTDSAEGKVGLPVKVNVSQEVLDAQVRANMKAGWAMLNRGWQGIDEVIIIGGGPSINSEVGKIKDLVHGRGLPVVTLNGAYHWCRDQMIFPAFQIVMDAREGNACFTHPVMPGTWFLIASQCHPSVLKGLPKKRTYLWQRACLDGGSTVMLCSVPLLQLMGTSKFHLFGFDSCFANDQHHAYPQPINDGDEALDVELEDRVFRTTRWMVSQAEEFLEMSGRWGEFKVYGEGMIAWMLNNQD